MLSYEQALQRLFHHANLTDAEEEGWSSFVGSLFRAKTSAVVLNLREPTDDLISCLDVVNNQVNGQTPSASVNGDDNQPIDRRAAYAVAATLTSGVESFLSLVDNAAADRSSALAKGKTCGVYLVPGRLSSRETLTRIPSTSNWKRRDRTLQHHGTITLLAGFDIHTVLVARVVIHQR